MKSNRKQGSYRLKIRALKSFRVIIFFLSALFLFPNISRAEEKDTFTVALTGKYPPFSFYSSTGELIGFDIDVTREIARRLGREPVIITTEWDSILAGLLVKKYDAIIGSMAVTPTRAEKVSFSTPYYVSGAQLFIQEKDRGEINGIEDLQGRKVGVGLGETYEHYLREKHPDIEVVPYRSAVDIFQDMLNGRIQGFVIDRLVGLYQIRRGEMPFVPAGSLLYEEKMAIPVTLDNRLLLEKINQALSRMREEGLVDRLHRKWFGRRAEEPSGTVKRMSAGVIAGILIRGFVVTLIVAAIALSLGFIISIPWGTVLNHDRSGFYFVFRFLNDFIRGTPLLIQLFFVYFGAPQIGITLSPISAAIFTLTVNSAAYMAEVVRSGLMSVDRGQLLAGRALGLSPLQIFCFVTWPQAFRVALPPLMNAVVALIKDTSLIAIISVSEVIREAQSIISVTYNPIKYYLIVALMFFVVTFPLMKLAGRIEKAVKKRGFSE
ncbi:MAG: ABC transporter substrate-binding protein/permease [Candidatus Auribacterota bacterium]|nr:ABC transporter substrate-binding protein/permease [Candidatus Auribacterota bacterium]